jgi:hypothetical protein
MQACWCFTKICTGKTINALRKMESEKGRTEQWCMPGGWQGGCQDLDPLLSSAADFLVWLDEWVSISTLVGWVHWTWYQKRAVISSMDCRVGVLAGEL